MGNLTDILKVMAGRKLPQKAVEKALKEPSFRKVSSFLKPSEFEGNLDNLYFEGGKIVRETAVYDFERRDIFSKNGKDQKYFLTYFERLVYSPEGLLERKEVGRESFSEGLEFREFNYNPAGSFSGKLVSSGHKQI